MKDASFILRQCGAAAALDVDAVARNDFYDQPGDGLLFLLAVAFVAVTCAASAVLLFLG